MKKLLILSLLTAVVAASGLDRAYASIPIVAAENFYGDIARQIGGPDVAIVSIVANPDQDPHLFEASPSVARSVAAADIVIYNGMDYDPWMDKLLAGAGSDHRSTIVAAKLGRYDTGANPHVWYVPDTMLAVARRLTGTLEVEDPQHYDGYDTRFKAFEQSLIPVNARIAGLRKRLAGTPVTASEPVFYYVFAALGMNVRDQSFQLSVMNNTEPSASDIAAMEDDLRTHKVKLFVYNTQASDPVAARMEKIATAAGVPVLGVTETEPSGMRYQDWLLAELDAVDKALPH